MTVFSPKNHFTVTITNGLGQAQEWDFYVLPQKHSRFGPDFLVKRGNETANVYLDEAGFHADNQQLIGSMPSLANDAYQGYLLGAVDAYEQTKHKQSVKDSDWRETGNHIAHSSPGSSGWRIHSLVKDDTPPIFKVRVKAQSGHVTDYAYDEKNHLVTHSTSENPLPDDVHQVAIGMLSGQQHGAAQASERFSSQISRLEAKRSAASCKDHSR